MFFFDPVYFLFVGPALLLSMWAAFKVKSTFHRYNQVPASSGASGAQVASELLLRHGLDMPVEEFPGQLSDHYDPRVRRLRLSSDVYRGRSIGAIGVAAHEAGHAIQHATGYKPLLLRHSVAPIAQFGSSAWIWVMMAGFLFGSLGLVKLGILLFVGVVVFQIVTLPVELNASSRAKQMVYESGFVTESERGGVSKVLSAAAMTYVAAALTSIATLLYYLMRAGLLGGRSDD
ncbi:MAG TPA: zinc metallopeptidase [Vicinamibacteria bacterium]|nr:zinc metallopeptidase [Vicinamibacteria bacterium]